MQPNKKNIIVELTFQFALEIISYYEILEEKRKFVVSNQLLKSGTSIGANVREAQNAESRVDFIHKMKIAAKETDETAFWLELCEASANYPSTKKLRELNEEIQKILSRIISTSKKSQLN